MKSDAERRLEKKIQQQDQEIKILKSLLKDTAMEQKKLLHRALKAEAKIK